MSINDKTQLESCNQIWEIVQDATPHLSFWGGRYISGPKCSNGEYIDDIANRLARVIKQNLEFSEDVRNIGKKIFTKLDEMYSNLDDQEDRRNLFTNFLCEVRRIFSRYILNSSSYICWTYASWSNVKMEELDLYTISQFQKAFKCTPKEAKQKGFCLTYFKAHPSESLPELWKVELIVSPKNKDDFALFKKILAAARERKIHNRTPEHSWLWSNYSEHMLYMLSIRESILKENIEHMGTKAKAYAQARTLDRIAMGF